MPPKRFTRTSSQPPAPVSPTKRGRGRSKADTAEPALSAPVLRQANRRVQEQDAVEQEMAAVLQESKIYDGPQLDPALEHEGQLVPPVPILEEPINPEESHDHSGLSGATAVNDSSDLPDQLRKAADIIPAELPNLENAAGGVLKHLIDGLPDPTYISPLLATLDSDAFYRRRRSALDLAMEWFSIPGEFYIDAQAVIRAVFDAGPAEPFSVGPWRPDTILCKANLAHTVCSIFAMDPLNSSIAAVLQEIDGGFGRNVLAEPAGFRYDNWEDKTAIIHAILECMLNLRTQIVIARVRSEAHDASELLHIIAETFFKDGTAQPIPYLPSNTIFDQHAFAQKYAERVRALNASAAEVSNESQLVDADRLAEKFPWEYLCASAVEMARHILPVHNDVFESLSPAAIGQLFADRGKRHKRDREAGRRTSGPLSTSKSQSKPKKKNRAKGSKETKSGEMPRGIYKDSAHARKVNFDSPMSQLEVADEPQPSSAPAYTATQDHGFVPELSPDEADVQEAVRHVRNQEQIARRQKRAASPDAEQSPRKRLTHRDVRTDEAEDASVYEPGPDQYDENEFMTLENGTRVLKRDMEEPPLTQLESIRAEARFYTARHAATKAPQTRTKWTAQEENRLLDLIAAHGCGWSRLKQRDADTLNWLANRSGEDCRLKARNVKFDYLKSRHALPKNFENVVLNKAQKAQLAAMGIEYEQRQIRARATS